MRKPLENRAVDAANEAADMRRFGAAARLWRTVEQIGTTKTTRETARDNAERYEKMAENAILRGVGRESE